MIQSLIFLYQRDIQRLHAEISAYKEEKNLWLVEGEISNSAGNLCLHLVGNLNHFIGHVLGGTDYVRNREFEFAGKNVERKKLLESIHAVGQTVKETLEKLSEDTFSEPFPLQVFKTPYSTEQMLLHLAGHLNYHLGQINYHRRLLEKD